MKNSGLHVLGVMSGSSLDGLDLVLCRLSFSGTDIEYSIEKASTISFSPEIVNVLRKSYSASAAEIYRTEQRFTEECASAISQFLENDLDSIDLIGFHGHTIFHEPHGGYSVQIGRGYYLAQTLRTDVVGDFRNKDIALGGQGAPLAPIVEKVLMKEHQVFLNLGGIANISVHHYGTIKAFDITACNQALNHLVKDLNLEFDNKGQIAASGSLDKSLLQELSNLDYLSLNPPKSLSNSWVQNEFLPILDKSAASIPDKLYTVVEHVSRETSKSLQPYLTKKNVLVSGGGAHNDFLIQRLDHHLQDVSVRCEKPNSLMVDFKEAVLMALMAFLRIHELPNCLASVTGASRDSSTGIIYKASI